MCFMRKTTCSRGLYLIVTELSDTTMFRKAKYIEMGIEGKYRQTQLQSQPKCNKILYPIHDAVTTKNDSTTLVSILRSGNKVNDCDDNGNTPLHIAAISGSLFWTKALLKHGASFNILNNFQQSALMVASKNADVDIVKEIITIGAEVNQRNENGEISLHYAIMGGSLKCVKLLLEAKSKINCLARNESGTPLTLACQSQKTDIVQELVNYRGPPRINLNTPDHSTNGRMPIHWAVHTRNVKCLNILVKAGAELDVADSKGLTPLVQSITEGSAEVLDILIEAGCDRMAVDGLNGTTLTLSALLGHTACLKVLLNAHEDPNEFGHFGLTPLSCATFESNSNTVNVLLEHGADPNIRSRCGMSPLMVCLMKVTSENSNERHKILVSLIRSGADAQCAAEYPDPRTTMANPTNVASVSPVLYAAATGYISMLKVILAAGGIINCSDTRDWVCGNDMYDPCSFVGTFCKWYMHAKSLKLLCRWAVRANIVGQKDKGIGQLPLPQTLQDFLNYSELNHLPLQKAKSKYPFEAPMMSMLTRAAQGLKSLRGTLLYEAISQ